MQKHAVKVIFSGRVQGVGFRYTTMSIAGDFQISGYVRNIPGGDVELFAQGDESEVDAFVDVLCRRMGMYIYNQTTTVLPPDPRLKDFRVN